MKRRQFLQATAAVAATAPLVTACGSDHSLSIDNSLPVSSLGATSTAEEVTQGLDLSGKTALVTGCNSGIGYECIGNRTGEAKKVHRPVNRSTCFV